MTTTHCFWNYLLKFYELSFTFYLNFWHLQKIRQMTQWNLIFYYSPTKWALNCLDESKIIFSRNQCIFPDVTESVQPRSLVLCIHSSSYNCSTSGWVTFSLEFWYLHASSMIEYFFQYIIFLTLSKCSFHLSHTLTAVFF